LQQFVFGFRPYSAGCCHHCLPPPFPALKLFFVSRINPIRYFQS
jgi:hypothetical protein